MTVPTVCSVAAFDARNATPFRSTIPGKEPTQVGRWHAFRNKGVESPHIELPNDSRGVDWETVWAQPQTGDTTPSISELSTLHPQDIKNILYLSDNAHEGLSHHLEKYNQASKIGVIASSTPFVTGRPYTLFYDGSVHSSGAVGICFDIFARDTPEVWFPDLQEITGLLTVTNTEGNLVHTLDDQNPSRLILSALQINGSTNAGDVDVGIKDDAFFLGVFRHGKRYQLYNITGGDPSRGTISLQSDAAPDVGSKVKASHVYPANCPQRLTPSLQIYRKDADYSPKHSIRQGIEVLTVTPEDVLDLALSSGDDGVLTLEGTCLIPSENGFIVSRVNGQGCERAWTSTAAGGGACFSFA
ncbi:hypothetical protein PHLGIDRAFT_37276 [Phlebiopsis gigantea 11061_1 CR5-6]|uniref:FIST domain-containing protein n=1 Tax=Phlebiopsis gigantea (strain 11061_1 CR5-6) TaxID=745531 RepID=A0A0C3PE78_PHLG1|nr:hypothetical protein PHLGIDRAFT_37276 [Phlebiopsis gigantea 11061_1 CR5-6]